MTGTATGNVGRERSGRRSEDESVKDVRRIVQTGAMPRMAQGPPFGPTETGRRWEAAVAGRAATAPRGGIATSAAVTRRARGKADRNGTPEVPGTWTWKRRRLGAAGATSGTATMTTARREGPQPDAAAAPTIGSTTCSTRSPSLRPRGSLQRMPRRRGRKPNRRTRRSQRRRRKRRRLRIQIAATTRHCGEPCSIQMGIGAARSPSCAQDG
mmetsp:Transcript_114304/g.272046  ORF Transcript_114304/g.272046 Transcript_114304/m.272046 type:complete len:212 (-) Transcript_114304:39-674(-)